MSERPIIIEVTILSDRGQHWVRLEAPAGSTDADIQKIVEGWRATHLQFVWRRAHCQRRDGCDSPLSCGGVRRCLDLDEARAGRLLDGVEHNEFPETPHD